jgi:hypothetical protein
MRLLWVLSIALSALAPQLRQQDGKPCESVDGGSHALSARVKSVLASRYSNWEVRRQCVAEVTEVTDLDPRWASVASGDYDADGRIDHAILLQPKPATSGKLTIVVFLSSVGGEPVVAGEGNLYVSTVTRGSRGHNHDTGQDFTYSNDAIFSGDFHCCGYSLIWRDGKFIRVTTAD